MEPGGNQIRSHLHRRSIHDLLAREPLVPTLFHRQSQPGSADLKGGPSKAREPRNQPIYRFPEFGFLPWGVPDY